MNPVFPSFVLSLTALVLLILITFSAPFVPSFYFLQATMPGDTIRFGLWGYCFEGLARCSPKGLGYSWHSDIVVWMTKALVLHPIAAIFSLLSTLAIIPALITHRYRDTLFPPPLYSLLSIPAAITSLAAFSFTIALFTIARDRFRSDGAVPAFGALIWMSLASTIILLFLMLFTGCGVTWRGTWGEMSPHIRNRRSVVYPY